MKGLVYFQVSVLILTKAGCHLQMLSWWNGSVRGWTLKCSCPQTLQQMTWALCTWSDIARSRVLLFKSRMLMECLVSVWVGFHLLACCYSTPIIQGLHPHGLFLTCVVVYALHFFHLVWKIKDFVEHFRTLFLCPFVWLLRVQWNFLDHFIKNPIDLFLLQRMSGFSVLWKSFHSYKLKAVQIQWRVCSWATNKIWTLFRNLLNGRMPPG